MSENLLERFLRYVKVNTRSNPASKTVPSNPKEVAFLKDLSQELKSMGMHNVRTGKDGYVFADLPVMTKHVLKLVSLPTLIPLNSILKTFNPK